MQLNALPGQTGADMDLVFMEAALAEARRAADNGEVPVGALLVRGEDIVARAHNAPIGMNDPTAHAEVLVLRKAAFQERNYRLRGTTLYVTAEPCVMCVGALLHARIARVVFGCAEPRGGALGSVFDVMQQGRTNHCFEVRGGLRAEEARGLLQGFFRVRRGA